MKLKKCETHFFKMEVSNCFSDQTLPIICTLLLIKIISAETVVLKNAVLCKFCLQILYIKSKIFYICVMNSGINLS